MNIEQPGTILLLLAVLIGGVLVLRFAHQIARFLLAAGALAVAGLVAWAISAQATASRQVAQVATVQAATGAGTTLILFLVVLLLLLLLLIVGAIAALQWWRKRQEQQRLAEMVRMLQMQALLNSSRMPTNLPGQMPAPPVIVFPQVPQLPWVVMPFDSSSEDPQNQPWSWPFEV